MATGIRQRHGRGCKRTKGCKCPWEAFVWSRTDEKKIRKTFPTYDAARAWRDDTSNAVRTRKMRAPTQTTLEQAAKEWLEGARKGTILSRSGDRYKPAAIRTYEAALRLRVKPELGRERLSAIARADLQRFVNKLLSDGLSPATIMVTLLPVRAIFKQAIEVGDVAINPTAGLRMPAVRGGRDRIAAPEECAKLLAALARGDRALWATAMYAGLRRGELMALKIEDVDLAAGVIHVRRGWDAVEGEIATKSGKDRRVPIAAVLRDYLDEHLLGLDWQEGLVFGASAVSPFTGTPTAQRAKRAWKAAKLKAITFHECRHTFASLMIAAGVNAKALSTYLGHASIQITFDRYGHLMPGNEGEAAGLLDALLSRADDAARQAQPVETSGANPGASTLATAGDRR
jgi:integrase